MGGSGVGTGRVNDGGLTLLFRGPHVLRIISLASRPSLRTQVVIRFCGCSCVKLVIET